MGARGGVTVREVLDGLNAARPEAPRAYTTVLTSMQRLEARGVVSKRRSEKRDVYTPVMAREQYLGRRVDAEVPRLVEDFGELALAALAATTIAFVATVTLDALRFHLPQLAAGTHPSFDWHTASLALLAGSLLFASADPGPAPAVLLALAVPPLLACRRGSPA